MRSGTELSQFLRFSYLLLDLDKLTHNEPPHLDLYCLPISF